LSQYLGNFASRAADRVDAAKYGIDPITIVTILTQVLPLLMSCWKRNELIANEPAPRSVLEDAYKKHPESMIRRTARRIRGEADEPMSKAMSFDLAKAVIEQSLADPVDTFHSCIDEAV
jgi:hypothetical protein